MANIETLEQRLARAKAALREAKKREKTEEEKRIFDAIRRSGLTLADVEKLAVEKSQFHAEHGE